MAKLASQKNFREKIFFQFFLLIMLEVVGSVFVAEGRPGDFQWELKQSSSQRNLYIICENVLNQLDDQAASGAGTAVIRSECWPFKIGRPMAAGIPTGWSVRTGGFLWLDNEVKFIIDAAFERIRILLQMYPDIDKIIYLCDSNDTSVIGAGIFQNTIGDGVLQYISHCLHELAHGSDRRPRSKHTLDSLRQLEIERSLRWAVVFDRNAELETENAALRKALTHVTAPYNR